MTPRAKLTSSQQINKSSPTRPSPKSPPRWEAQHEDLAALSPIVKNGSLKRQYGHVRLNALRQLARPDAMRVPPPDPPRTRQTSLPREILDRSLPPVPTSPSSPKSSSPNPFHIKRKSIPGPSTSLPNTPTVPVVAASAKADQRIDTPRPLPRPVSTMVDSHTTRPLSILRRPQPVSAPEEDEAAVKAARVRQIAGMRVKEAVAKIENVDPSDPSAALLSTPVRCNIVDRPCLVSSHGLSVEARRIMAEARLRRLA